MGSMGMTREVDFGEELRLLGNRPGTHGDWSMIHNLEDLMFFRRALEPLEMRDLCEWTSFAE